MVEYKITLTSSQLKETLKAIELLMRLKINQPNEIISAVLSWGEGMTVDEYCERRDNAEPLLKKAFDELFPTHDSCKKNAEWYRLYNLYSSIRYAIHEAEHPESKGVDSYPPSNWSDEPAPKLEWEKHE